MLEEDRGIIPRAKLRNELQDVHTFSTGFVAAGEGVQPALRMERAAMIHFGMPSYGWAGTRTDTVTARLRTTLCSTLC